MAPGPKATGGDGGRQVAPGYTVVSIGRSNIGKELSRRRRVDQALGRERAGDPPHLNREFGDLDQRDKAVEHRATINLMDACVMEDRPSGCLPAGISTSAPLSRPRLATSTELSHDPSLRLGVAQRLVKAPGRSTVIRSIETIRPSRPCSLTPDTMLWTNFGLMLISEKEAPIKQATWTVEFPKAEDRDVKKLAQLVQAGLEDVADQKGVVAFPLGAQAVLEHLGGIEELKVAVLVGDGAVRAEALDVDLRARLRGALHDSFQKLAVGAVARSAGNTEALVEKSQGDPPQRHASPLAHPGRAACRGAAIAQAKATGRSAPGQESTRGCRASPRRC